MLKLQNTVHAYMASEGSVWDTEYVQHPLNKLIRKIRLNIQWNLLVGSFRQG